jgi:hypothetical protein
MTNVFGDKFAAQVFQAVKSAIETVGFDTIKAGPFFGIQETPTRNVILQKAA